MKRLVRNKKSNAVTSELVAIGEAATIRPGDRVTATGTWDLGENAQIPKGARGTVDSVNSTSGAVEILMDTKYKGLDGWDNHVLLLPFDTEDITSKLECSPNTLLARVAHLSRKPVPYQHLGLAIVACALFVGSNLHTSSAAFPQPVVYKSFKATKASISVGEDLSLTITYMRDRPCATLFERSIEQASDGLQVHSERQFGGIAQTTDGEYKTITLSVRLPDNLKPGDYVYSGLTQSTCSNGGTYDMLQPRVPFTVK